MPLSYRYLMVVQDYFTKWPEAIPLPDHTANWITSELVKLLGCQIFCTQIKGEILRAPSLVRHWRHLVSTNLAPQPITHNVVECFNRSLLQMLRSYVNKEVDWECYVRICHWFCMHTGQQHTQLEFHLSSSCLADNLN